MEERLVEAQEVPSSRLGVGTTESATEWSVTGPENRGARKGRGSIPPLSAMLA